MNSYLPFSKASTLWLYQTQEVFNITDIKNLTDVTYSFEVCDSQKVIPPLINQYKF